MLNIKYFFSFLFTCLSFITLAQKNLSAKEVLELTPNGDKAVYDFGGFLSEQEAMTISQKLSKHFDSTGNQIVVITLKSLDGSTIAQYATELGHKWGIGEAKEDNGVVLLLSMEDRKSNIATGYGAEGTLPDITCKRILDEVTKPLFKTGQYYQGIDLTTNVIIAALAGEGYENSRSKGENPIVAIIIIAVIFLVIFWISKNNNGGNFMSSRGSGSFNPGFFFFPGGGGSGGGGNSGGGGFGGFGGFGGGGFGGGGASGDW